MESDKLIFKVVEGIPSKDLLEDILVVYKSIFDDYKLDFFKNRIHQKEHLIIILCYQQEQLIGFKIGYQYNDTTFYSWVGGVLPKYRRKGIAKKLAHLQEQKVKEKLILLILKTCLKLSQLYVILTFNSIIDD